MKYAILILTGLVGPLLFKTIGWEMAGGFIWLVGVAYLSGLLFYKKYMIGTVIFGAFNGAVSCILVGPVFSGWEPSVFMILGILNFLDGITSHESF